MPRAIPAGATTAAARKSTRPRSSRSSGPASCSTAAFANVQPHSGAQANQAVFMALLQAGRHLHGHGAATRAAISRTARRPTSRASGSRSCPTASKPDTHLIDYEQMEEVARREKPKLIVAGASAYLAPHRLGALPQGGGRDRRLLHGRHGALCRPRRGRRLSQPAAACPCRDDDDAQDAARPARRHDPVERRRDRQEDQLRGVPGPAGRPADAHHRRPRRWPSARRCGPTSRSTPRTSSTMPARWPRR